MKQTTNQAKLTLRKRIGSTVYVTKLYVRNDAAETMDDKWWSNVTQIPTRLSQFCRMGLR